MRASEAAFAEFSYLKSSINQFAPNSSLEEYVVGMTALFSAVHYMNVVGLVIDVHQLFTFKLMNMMNQVFSAVDTV